jgi:hypothetical protein
MPSLSLQRWFAERADSLDEMERAHRALRGSGPGVRAATLQINQAYTMMLSGQFQGYCRDLHDECAIWLAAPITDPGLRSLLVFNLQAQRRLDRGNPNPGNIGADFNRLNLLFWPRVEAHHLSNAARRTAIEELNEWRNAIAHQDFPPAMLSGGRPQLPLSRVRAWRTACDGLVRSFDDVLRSHINHMTGVYPW